VSTIPLRALGALLLLSLSACSSSGSDEAAPTSQVSTSQLPASQVTTVVPAPECDAAREVAAVLAGIDLSDRAGIEALPDHVAELADVLPAELGPDVDVLGTAVRGVVDVLRRFDFDLAAIEADADAQLDLEELNRPEVVTATQNIQSWIDTSCA
jgi:hypothetical protein